VRFHSPPAVEREYKTLLSGDNTIVTPVTSGPTTLSACSDAKGRPLTVYELNIARGVFGDSIDYSKVRIIKGKYFAGQSDGIPMAPNGNIYWPQDNGDLTTVDSVTFIHEMTHVYQHQHGVNVRAEGIPLQVAHRHPLMGYDAYAYDFVQGKPFESYTIEQQSEIAEGIFLGYLPNIIPQGPPSIAMACPAPRSTWLPPVPGTTTSSNPTTSDPKPTPGPSVAPT
jgi:hypothetical protein